MPDMDAVEVNFDGITYAKGASVIKQLVAYVGIEPFVAGLRDYFGKHAWGNATFGDLLTSLEAASGVELRDFAAQWLETAQVNTLRPVVTLAADGDLRERRRRAGGAGGLPDAAYPPHRCRPLRPGRRRAGRGARRSR